jgi:hypothetical protein
MADLKYSEIVNIANNWLKNNDPNTLKEAKNLRSIISDQGETWEVTYQLPPNTLGGFPLIVIDKKTRTVKNVYATQ